MASKKPAPKQQPKQKPRPDPRGGGGPGEDKPK